MIIRPRDTLKLFGILIMCACAVFICTLFMNHSIDMTRIKDQITSPEIMGVYDVIVTSGKAVCAVSGGVLLLTTVITLLFYIKHYIDTHKSELGILKALGYSNIRITMGFWVFGLSVFAGTAAGFFSSFAMMPAFYRQMNSKGVLPDVPLHFNPLLAVYLIIMPALAFSILAILYGYFKLRRPALELIRGKGKVKARNSTKKSTAGSETPFLRDLGHSTVRSRLSLVFFIAFSSFCYSATTQQAASMRELSSEMMAAMMVGVGFVLALTTLLLAVTTVIKGNAKTIAMMRVFGYSDRECARAILDGYRPTAYIGFILGTVYQYGLMKAMMTFYYAQSVIEVPEYNFSWGTFAVSLISFAVIYEVIMFVYAAGIKRMPLKTVMQEE